MLRSRLLDAGKDIIYVYPETKVTDRRGNIIRLPSETPVKVYATSSPDRSSIAELPGQIEVEIIKFVAREAPIASWARVVFDGREWDLASPPRHTAGVSKTTAHVSFTLRSRPIKRAAPDA